MNLVKTMRERVPVFHAILMIAGTAIGAGMIALPIVTANDGVFGSVFVYGLCWFFSLLTGFLLVQVQQWLPKPANFMTMSRQFLGIPGYMLTGFLYIFLFYSLAVAYITGTASIVNTWLPLQLPLWVSPLVLCLIVGNVVYFGMRGASKINFYLMLGLVACYFGFLWYGSENFNIKLLEGGSVKNLLYGLPIIYTAFGYQSVIPTICTYLHGDMKKIRYAIVVGVTLPFLAYVCWDVLIKGIIPSEGSNSLQEAKEMGLSVIEPLSASLKGSPIAVLGNCFAFFALATSFLGVTVGLCDFLLDALCWPINRLNRFKAVLLVFIPPLMISLVNPHSFLLALGLAGGFGCAIILGLMPVLMILRGKYVLQYPCSSHGLYHWTSLMGILLFAVFVVGLEFWDVISKLL